MGHFQDIAGQGGSLVDNPGFDFGLGVNLGWKHTNAARIESETVGFLITYAVSFGPWPE